MNQSTQNGRRGWFRNLCRKLTTKPAARRPGKSALRFESLEPRLALNADPSYNPTSAYSIQADLEIWVNGTKVEVPVGIGDTTGIQSFGANGQLRIQPNVTVPGSKSTYVTLGDFFAEWRTDPDAEDRRTDAVLTSSQLFNNLVDNTHSLYMFVNGAPSTDFGAHKFHDGDSISLVYTANPVVVLNTNQGHVPIELLRNVAPGTVANFLNYAKDGDYNNSVFHRYVPGFVLQGGGFRTTSATFTNASQLTSIPTDAAIQNEFNLSNTAGTIAMAKLGGNPNSATNQFFINLGNNAANLDNQNGGFTVFARLLDSDIIAEVASLTTTNAGGAFNELPLAANNQLVVLESISGDGRFRGLVYNDTDADGTRDTGEVGLAGITVYIDANNNGFMDDGELRDVTDANGEYGFAVPAGQYFVRMNRKDEFNQTSPAAAQTVIVQMGADVTGVDFGAAPTQVSFRYEITDVNNNPLTRDLNVGEEFLVNVFVRDTRTTAPNGFGVFAAYHDMTFPANRVSVVGTPTFSAIFPNGRAGTVGNGIIDELGAFQNALSPPGQDEQPVVTVRFRVDNPGPIALIGDAPDILPDHEILVYGGTSGVTANRVSQARVLLNATSGPRSPNDTFNFDEDSGAHTLNVLTNDAIEGTTPNLLIVSVGAPSQGGTVTIASDGKSLSYTSAPNFFGVETFTYVGHDGNENYNATVTVQVVPTNDPPTAVNDTVTVQRGSANNVLDVLGNDLIAPDQNDPNEQLRVTNVSASQQGGTVTIGSGSLFVLYTPPANFVGTDTFTYTLNDRANGTGFSSTATVTVNVSGAAPDSFTVLEDSLSNSLNPLANDTTASGSNANLTITTVTQGNRGGTVTIEAGSKTVNYKPAANFFGEETFTYTTNDGAGMTATGTVTVTVTNVNDNPTAVNDTFVTTRNAAAAVVNVLANDSSAPDTGEVLTVTAVTQGAQGGIVTLTNGVVRYQPANNFNGTDTFTYTISDGNGGSATATVTVTVSEFTPSSIRGFVYLDANNNGAKDPGERPIAGVELRLTGTDNTGAAVTRSVFTGADGGYQFLTLPPGSYTVTQVQPPFLADGQESSVASFITYSANDTFQISLDQNVNVTALNFGELGRQAAYISIRDLFASTPRESVFAAVNTVNGLTWVIPGAGWEGYSITNAQLDASATQLRLDVHQDSLNQNLTTVVPTVAERRARVLAEENGTQLIRLYGAPALFSLTAASNSPPVITSNGGGATASINVVENTTSVTTVTATDTDLPAQTLTYSIAGGADAAKFIIGSTTGILTFASAPSRGNPTDVGADNVYNVIVQVSDGSATDTQAIAVTVTLAASGEGEARDAAAIDALFASENEEPDLTESALEAALAGLWDDAAATDAVLADSLD